MYDSSTPLDAHGQPDFLKMTYEMMNGISPKQQIPHLQKGLHELTSALQQVQQGQQAQQAQQVQRPVDKAEKEIVINIVLKIKVEMEEM
jgi:hypothetical protein